MNQNIDDGRQARTSKLEVRVSLAEKKQIKAMAKEAGLTLSDWIRNKAIGSKPLLRKPTPDREILLRFLAAFGKAGSNLNQVARQLNRKQESEEFEIPLAYINQLLTDMKNLTDKLRNIFNNDRQG